MQTEQHTANIKLAILHGSRATGNMHTNSDWDVAVLADHALSWEDRAGLRRIFAEKLGAPEERIDLSDLRADSPLLRYRVAMHGKLIDGDEREFRAFQIRAWKDYLNNEKIVALQSAFLQKALS